MNSDAQQHMEQAEKASEMFKNHLDGIKKCRLTWEEFEEIRKRYKNLVENYNYADIDHCHTPFSIIENFFQDIIRDEVYGTHNEGYTQTITEELIKLTGITKNENKIDDGFSIQTAEIGDRGYIRFNIGGKSNIYSYFSTNYGANRLIQINPETVHFFEDSLVIAALSAKGKKGICELQELGYGNITEERIDENKLKVRGHYYPIPVTGTNKKEIKRFNELCDRAILRLLD